MSNAAGSSESAQNKNDVSQGEPTPASSPPHEALAVLRAIARFHQIAADPANLAHQLRLAPSADVSTQDLLRAGKRLGLKSKLSKTTPDRLALTPLPALAQIRGADNTLRTVILDQTDGQRVLLQNPSLPGGRPTIEPMDVLAQ